jgi:hypothetical protein
MGIRVRGCAIPRMRWLQLARRRCHLMAMAATALAGCQTATARGAHRPVEPPPPCPPLPQPPACKPPRIGLALGGGAARGFAHIGVIQVLEEAGIRPTWWSAPRPAAWWRRCMPRARTAGRTGDLALTMDEGPSPTGRSRAAGDPRRSAGALRARAHRRQPIEAGPAAGHRRHRPGQRRGVLFQRGDTGHRGARLERGAGGLPAGEASAGGNTWTAAWWRRCRCALRGRWGPNWCWRWTSRPARRQCHRRRDETAAADLRHHGPQHQPVRAARGRRGAAAAPAGRVGCRLHGARARHPAGREAALALLPDCVKARIASSLNGRRAPQKSGPVRAGPKAPGAEETTFHTEPRGSPGLRKVDRKKFRPENPACKSGAARGEPHPWAFLQAARLPLVACLAWPSRRCWSSA